MSLERWLNICGEDILKYISERKEDYSKNDFMEYFNTPDDLLLSGDLSLATMHVTTNNDDCFSLKKYGLRNLQDAIRLDTPLNRYLKKHGVKIDLEHRQIKYKNDSYDVSMWKKGFSLSSVEKNSNYVYRKLYEDHQVNGFLSHRNILDYGGGVRRRPEFLHTLGELLRDRCIEDDWENNDDKCYVLKYKADISKFIYFTFSIEKYECEEFEDEPYQIELLKRKCLLGYALTVLHNNMFGHSTPEFISYMNPDAIVTYDAIIKIYTDIEYIKEYNVADRR